LCSSATTMRSRRRRTARTCTQHTNMSAYAIEPVPPHVPGQSSAAAGATAHAAADNAFAASCLWGRSSIAGWPTGVSSGLLLLLSRRHCWPCAVAGACCCSSHLAPEAELANALGLVVIPYHDLHRNMPCKLKHHSTS
jgi:hypothetical protein